MISMNKPLVSIALCTYNGATFLTEQLDSVVNQSYPNLEIIIVDDQSKDDTVNILKTYAAKYSNIKVFENETNLGYIKNFERAINLCNGAFISLCDQDDIWELNKIEILINEIQDHILIYHDSEFIQSDGTPMNKFLSDVINMYEGESYKPFLLSNSVSGHACMFRKELANYCLPFPTGIFHDRWIAYSAGNRGSIKYINAALVKYRQHEKSDTNILKLKREKAETILYGRIKIEKTLKELEIFAAFPFNKDQPFVSKLLKLYRTRLTAKFCFRLTVFMYANYKSLLYISKKSTLSKFNFILKYLWGAKLRAN